MDLGFKLTGSSHEMEVARLWWCYVMLASLFAVGVAMVARVSNLTK